MTFAVEPLTYSVADLAPHISEETLHYHHGEHYAGYVRSLNELVDGTSLAERSLEELLRQDAGKVCNLASQAWNHAFYFRSMTPAAGQGPGEILSAALRQSFGSLDRFQERFVQEATSHFGSGWVWLVMGAGGVLSIESTHDAGNPLAAGRTPLLTCDVWEHAYYLDHRNERGKYLEAWWQVVNWGFVEECLQGVESGEAHPAAR